MPEGTNHTPAQNKAIDAKARVLIPRRRTTFSVISPVLLSLPDVGPTFGFTRCRADKTFLDHRHCGDRLPSGKLAGGQSGDSRCWPAEGR